ncbi:putative dihydrofolate reductase [Pseudomonas phage OBP]|uniref:dihydrofolate reductase n=1 Tax=Pseudomonas phage OBP TaxID=1124849 RepID=UPI000240D5D5|nr:dihydrofolate reductase [Pseudomonas phage OBP]AEV89678.1 putative dihydrofolate reductase [Pseudomonas phage OBP]
MNQTFYKVNTFASPLSYSLILAADERGGIGLDNDLPWKLAGVNNKSDMQWFRDKTKGKIIIMGYNTWVSIGRKPLPGRYNVIITEKHYDEVGSDLKAWGEEYYKTEKGQASPIHSAVCKSPSLAVAYLENTLGYATRGGEVMVIGGARIYEAFMEYASRIYLTTFEGEFKADTFVKLDLTDFELRYRDTMGVLDPKFEIWDVTEQVAKRPDSEIIQISYGLKEATGWVADIVKDKE